MPAGLRPPADSLNQVSAGLGTPHDSPGSANALEARIQELDPELRLPPRFHKPDPIFVRGELYKIVLAILREAGEPLPLAVIAVRALAQKGHTLPGPTLRKRTRHKIRNALMALDKRRVTVRIGERRAAKRGLR